MQYDVKLFKGPNSEVREYGVVSGEVFRREIKVYHRRKRSVWTKG